MAKHRKVVPIADKILGQLKRRVFIVADPYGSLRVLSPRDVYRIVREVLKGKG